jgi:pimeloyl-ACP methyl ester carboxylesterase
MRGYTACHNSLGKTFSLESDTFSQLDLDVTYQTFTYRSQFIDHLPSVSELPNSEHDYLSRIPDREIMENISFRYPVFLPAGKRKTDKVIILLHGLNEKSWNKYLPWARQLVLRTGHAVLMFPISFHMNRAPADWGNPRNMNILSRQRMDRYAEQSCTSFANAAISDRLDNKPERFALSGYQSVMDLLNLVNHISSGKHPVFKEGSEIHFFGYSIGAFLSQVLMIANPNGIFNNSRFVLFAGGTVFSHINGTSRFIIDQQAFTQLRNYYLNHSSWRRRTLRSYVEVMQVKNIARAFMAMLSPEYFKGLRNKTFSSFNDQIMVMALEKDEVFPANDILSNFENTGVKVNLLDPPYKYSHESPFPVYKNADRSALVDKWFEVVLEEAGDFLRSYSSYGFDSSH